MIRKSLPFRSIAGLTALLTTLLSVAPAFAGWHQEELGWHISRIGGADGTSIVQKDTTFTVLNGANVLDTTQVFTLDYADVIPRGLASTAAYVGNSAGTQGAYLSDTTVVAYLIVQADSSAVPSITNGTFTVHLEGKQGGFSSTVATNARGWTRVDSTVTTLGAVRDEAIAIPIRTIGLYNSPLAFSTLRARTSGGTGIIGAARVFIRYWRNDTAERARN